MLQATQASGITGRLCGRITLTDDLVLIDTHPNVLRTNRFDRRQDRAWDCSPSALSPTGMHLGSGAPPGDSMEDADATRQREQNKKCVLREASTKRNLKKHQPQAINEVKILPKQRSSEDLDRNSRTIQTSLMARKHWTNRKKKD